MTAASRKRFAEVVRTEPVNVALACLLIGCEVEPDLEVERPLAMLDTLASTARRRVSPDTAPALAAEGLRVTLGEQAGFSGLAGDYEDVRSSLLHEVLRRGRGLPILLSVLWCEVAARLDVPAVPLGLPGHVLVCIGDPLGEHALVDPFHGGRPAQAAAGYAAMPAHELLLRVLTNVRVLTSRQERSMETTRTRLWATELSLLLPHHPVGLRRERGELLVRLGDHLGGAAELEEYASLVEPVDEDEAQLARAQGRLARARLN